MASVTTKRIIGASWQKVALTLPDCSKNPTWTSATGAPSSVTVAVSLWVVPIGLSPLSGVRTSVSGTACAVAARLRKPAATTSVSVQARAMRHAKRGRSARSAIMPRLPSPMRSSILLPSCASAPSGCRPMLSAGHW